MLDTMPQTPAVSSPGGVRSAPRRRAAKLAAPPATADLPDLSPAPDGDDHDDQQDDLGVAPTRALARQTSGRLPTQTSQPEGRLPAQSLGRAAGESGVTIVPARQTAVSRAGLRAPAPEPRHAPWISTRAIVAFTLVITILVVALGFNTRGGSPQLVFSTPPPSGSGPFSASVNSVIVQIPAPTATPLDNGSGGSGSSDYSSLLQPCQQRYQFIPNISQWSVPPGCYSYIYIPNPANYVSRPGFGWCNWWVRVTHPNHPDITENTAYPRSLVPAVGAPIFFDGGEQGADPAGHWAVTVAVSPDHYWVLISEMNFAWRGGGFGRIDYRYIHVSPHVHFVYVFS